MVVPLTSLGLKVVFDKEFGEAPGSHGQRLMKFKGMHCLESSALLYIPVRTVHSGSKVSICKYFMSGRSDTPPVPILLKAEKVI